MPIPDGQAFTSFPRDDDDSVGACRADARAAAERDRANSSDQGIRAMLRVPFDADGLICEFCCESRTPREPSFELHAAAELFAQMFAMRLAID